MKFVSAVLLVVIFVLVGSVHEAQADLMKDVCAKRAEEYSGYKNRGLSIGDKQGRLSISGSVSIGVIAQNNGDGSAIPPYTDRETPADRELDAQVRTYWQVYDDCMSGQ